MRHFKVTSDESGFRLDRFLAKAEPCHTRAFVQKLIKGGSVFVNSKKTLKPAHKLDLNDELTVVVPSIREVGIMPEKIPLKIVYEDSDLVVVNKAPGMVVHPSDHGAHVSGTLVNAVMHHCKDLSGIGGQKRPGIVHRLDKDTSGLIIVAKNDSAHNSVATQIQARKVKKIYVTLLKGRLKPEEGSIEAPLLITGGRGPKDVHISAARAAKYALTHYKVLKYVGGYSLVQVQIVTGRTHQIRVHFAGIGHPVCGDDMYGDASVNRQLRPLGLTRQFLHAAELEFIHPTTKKILHLKAPLPKDLEDVLKKL
jgi:23S rRNA pseudouridine1911/1915/1917 synthase